MRSQILSDISSVETFATGARIREIARLRRVYGRGRWRKRKGIATIRLANGSIRLAELHWYEATGIGRKEFKIKELSLNIGPMGKSISKQLVVCVDNDGYPASLEKRKLYVMIEDPAAEQTGSTQDHRRIRGRLPLSQGVLSIGRAATSHEKSRSCPPRNTMPSALRGHRSHGGRHEDGEFSGSPPRAPTSAASRRDAGAHGRLRATERPTPNGLARPGSREQRGPMPLRLSDSYHSTQAPAASATTEVCRPAGEQRLRAPAISAGRNRPPACRRRRTRRRRRSPRATASRPAGSARKYHSRDRSPLARAVLIAFRMPSVRIFSAPSRDTTGPRAMPT